MGVPHIQAFHGVQLSNTISWKRNDRLRLSSAAGVIDFSPSKGTNNVSLISAWPCGDELDKEIVGVAIPAIINFAIVPLVGAVDTFWVGRMANALALAGQGAANQIFSSSSFVVGFLPSVVTPLVAEAAGAGNLTTVQARVAEASFIATLTGFIGTVCLLGFTDKALALVLPAGSAAAPFARPYLRVRALTFLPTVLSQVFFAAFRGTMDFVTPLRITMVANIVNVIMDPLLIFSPVRLGVTGAAAATCISEIVAIVMYSRQLIKRKIIKLSSFFRVPSWEQLRPLILGGITIQMRALAFSVSFIALQRTTQAMDSTGVAAAAYTISLQFWQLGGIILMALSTVASTIIPARIARADTQPLSTNPNEHKYLSVKQTADRLLLWGLSLGVVLGSVQLCSIPILKVFSPIPEVAKAARTPSIILASVNFINGLVFAGEGIMLGNRRFLSLGIHTAIGSAAMVTCLNLFGKSTFGVYGSLFVLNFVRLVGVLRYHFIVSPFAETKIKNITNEKTQSF